LEFTEENRWYGAHWIGQDAAMERIFEIANNTRALSISQRIADHEPLNGADANG
jgi:hypothetical protein